MQEEPNSRDEETLAIHHRKVAAVAARVSPATSRPRPAIRLPEAVAWWSGS